MGELTTADRLAIQETLSRYCHCLDRGQWDDFAAFCLRCMTKKTRSATMAMTPKI